MSAEPPSVSELHLIVGFDGSPPAIRALETAARMLSVRPPGRITVAWVAHLSGAVELSADATSIVESDFGQLAEEIRAEAAKCLGNSEVPWDFTWRQGLIAQELIAAAESIQAAKTDDLVVILVGSASSAMQRVVGAVAVTLARHSPVPITVVPRDHGRLGADAGQDELGDGVQRYRGGVDDQVIQGCVGRIAAVQAADISVAGPVGRGQPRPGLLLADALDHGALGGAEGGRGGRG